ncbi:putative fluoride ion transport protein CrcB [Halobacterium hubeiense]|uniref:Fluoride-specific ion channel FluC n=2 Tax=Halobacterium TaxID=2239 RepID=A0A0U5D095_9EURY|nr:fluoride efflux transporter CrcB [Halobacterium hubeiense]CQH60583.1 putative fluoride ion transport protein CrcB [Halobacterium hubeiense]
MDLSLPSPMLVGLGGALGAVLRFAVGELVQTEDYPASTLVVNVVGSFALAALTFAGASDDAMLLLGTGACGAFTTFSSFSVDVVGLVEDKRFGAAAFHALGNLIGAGVAIGLAWLLVG